MKVGHAVGLSINDHGGGRWRIRWRQNEVQPDGSVKRLQREVMAYSVEERKRLEVEIEEAVRTHGFWNPPDSETKARPVDLNLEHVGVAWLRWKVGVKGIAPTTRAALAGHMGRWFKGLRAVLKLKATTVVAATAMTSANIAKVTVRWRTQAKPYGDGTIYQTVAAVVDMWTWAADQVEYQAAMPRPPYNIDTVMPATPIYEAPEHVATLAECDACLRAIRLPMPRRMATIMRYTGLRLEQVANVYREDFDLTACSVLVRKGKSRREKAMNRRVPVAPGLLADLRPWLEALPAGPLFPDLTAKDESGASVPMRAYRNQTRYVTEAWEAATLADEARREVWAPPSREKNRPDHVFRAAFQSFLMDQGIGDNVIDYLVGHSAKSTRGKHYARPGDVALRRAVDLLPAVDWKETAGANVVYLARKTRA